MKKTTPQEIWNKLAQNLDSPADMKALRGSCISGFNAVAIARAPKISAAIKDFRSLEFTVPPALMSKATVMHPTVPDGRGLIMFVDESESPARGIEIAWVEAGGVIQVPLGISGHPNLLVTKVTDIRFSPSGNELAMLATTNPTLCACCNANSFCCQIIPDGTHVEPQGESTVLIVDLKRDSSGSPRSINVYDFGDMFMPEYGFDLVWGAPGSNAVSTLFFVALVHREHGAGILLVHWANFREALPIGFQIAFATIMIPSLFWNDKMNAFQERETTYTTSRVELSDDGRTIFFETTSVCAVMKIHFPSEIVQGPVQMTTSSHAFKQRSLSGAASSQTGVVFPSIMRMSPDGSLVCRVINVPSNSTRERPRTYIEMLAIPSEALVFRTVLTAGFSSQNWESHMFDKHPDLANQVMGYSKDSSLVWVRSCVITSRVCWIDYGCLPAVFDARSGRMLQDFGRVAQPYHFVNVAPCASNVYGMRREMGRYVIDAIDVISGKVVKTVRLPHTDTVPGRFLLSGVFRTSCDTVLSAARGNLDMLWEVTRASAGTQWTRETDSRPTVDLYL